MNARRLKDADRTEYKTSMLAAVVERKSGSSRSTDAMSLCVSRGACGPAIIRHYTSRVCLSVGPVEASHACAMAHTMSSILMHSACSPRLLRHHACTDGRTQVSVVYMPVRGSRPHGTLSRLARPKASRHTGVMSFQLPQCSRSQQRAYASSASARSSSWSASSSAATSAAARSSSRSAAAPPSSSSAVAQHQSSSHNTKPRRTNQSSARSLPRERSQWVRPSCTAPETRGRRQRGSQRIRIHLDRVNLRAMASKRGRENSSVARHPCSPCRYLWFGALSSRGNGPDGTKYGPRVFTFAWRSAKW